MRLAAWTLVVHATRPLPMPVRLVVADFVASVGTPKCPSPFTSTEPTVASSADAAGSVQSCPCTCHIRQMAHGEDRSESVCCGKFNEVEEDVTFIRDNTRPLLCDPTTHTYVDQVIAAVEIIDGQRVNVTEFSCWHCGSRWIERKWRV